MSSILIDAFLFDEENEEEFAVHGISANQVAQVLDSVYVIFKNRKNRRGLYLLVGRDKGGLCISIPIERTNMTHVWRPITAWQSKTGERTALEKNERN
jgi:uncharacterized DUF497 family protein